MSTENYNSVLEWSCKIAKQESATMPDLTNDDLIEIITMARDGKYSYTDDQIATFRGTVKTVFGLADDDELVTDNGMLCSYIARTVHSGAALIGMAKKINGSSEKWQDWDVL